MSAYLDAIEEMRAKIQGKDEWHAINPEYAVRMQLQNRFTSGLEIAQSLDTGMSHINCSPVNDEPNAPFGGAKSSGVGRYGGRWSLDAFTELRWITLERGGRHYPPVF